MASAKEQAWQLGIDASTSFPGQRSTKLDWRFQHHESVGCFKLVFISKPQQTVTLWSSVPWKTVKSTTKPFKLGFSFHNFEQTLWLFHIQTWWLTTVWFRRFGRPMPPQKFSINSTSDTTAGGEQRDGGISGRVIGVIITVIYNCYVNYMELHCWHVFLKFYRSDSVPTDQKWYSFDSFTFRTKLWQVAQVAKSEFDLPFWFYHQRMSKMISSLGPRTRVAADCPNTDLNWAKVAQWGTNPNKPVRLLAGPFLFNHFMQV